MTTRNPNKLYKDPRKGKLMGVAAGLADYSGVNANLIRIALVIGSLLGWFLPLLIIYIVLGVALEARPTDLYENEDEERFWRGVRTRPDHTAVELRKRFRRIDERLQTMESYITSKRFRLDRDLRDLER